jgi:hypothetical protein
MEPIGIEGIFMVDIPPSDRYTQRFRRTKKFISMQRWKPHSGTIFPDQLPVGIEPVAPGKVTAHASNDNHVGPLPKRIAIGRSFSYQGENKSEG